MRQIRKRLTLMSGERVTLMSTLGVCCSRGGELSPESADAR